ncbi:MAG: aldo/keto reductase [Tannerella sp.]|jgi:predicted aldo/keto reductase-like oxidoreductase|nr:aldo/keto reductase [Tannerella sp.]
MEYRRLGKTGLQTGIIGLGCEHLDGGKPYGQIKETIDAAIEGGVNTIDVFMPGRDIREAIAKALGERRKNVIIQGHIGSTDINQQYDVSRDPSIAHKYFEDMLRIFGGHIELGMMFFIDTDDDYRNVFDTGFAEYVQRLKQQGDIGHIGFGSHNPVTAIKVIETGLPEMLMFSINPAFDMLPAGEYIFDHFDNDFGKDLFKGIDPERAALYALCEQRGIGINAMKPLGAGKLISADHTPFAKPLTIGQCLHYTLSRPGVACALTGCKTADEMKGVLNYLQLTEEEKDFSEILGTMRNDFKGSCVYCNHCQPCPSEIDIAAVNKYLDIAKLNLNEIPPSVKSHYKGLMHKADECTQCGHCENRCPFGVPVIQIMEEADRVFK